MTYAYSWLPSTKSLESNLALKTKTNSVLQGPVILTLAATQPRGTKNMSSKRKTFKNVKLPKVLLKIHNEENEGLEISIL